VRLQQASAENETVSSSKEAQALLNLNMKLQTTAVKAQSKTIDLELKKLESAQLADQMRIITAYLPDPYYETEADSTTVFLFFKRTGAKTDILNSTISILHGLPGSLHDASSEVLVGICELRGKLRHFSTLNYRFASIISRSSPEDWLNYGKTLPELSGVEGKLDSWISAMRSDEFNEGDCARGLSSLIAQFDHLSETVFSQDGLDNGEIQLGLAWSFDYDLDNFAAAVGFARQAIVGLAAEDGMFELQTGDWANGRVDVEVDVGDSSLVEGVYEPVQRILDLVRSVKVPSG
jgi:dynactin 1